MHNDYSDFVAEKQKVKERAEWHDVKMLVRKLLGIADNQLHVKRFTSGTWNGWFVDVYCDADLSKLKRNISKCVLVGKRTVFIGIVE